MDHVPPSLIISLSGTYILVLILISLLIYRFITLRRSPSCGKRFSALWWIEFLINDAAFFTIFYVVVATWLWVISERYAQESFNELVININPEQTSENWGMRFGLPQPMSKLSGEQTEQIRSVIQGEIGMWLIYVCAMTCVKAAFVALTRMAWGELKIVGKVFWWIWFVLLILCFVGLVGLGLVIFGYSVFMSTNAIRSTGGTVVIATAAYITFVGYIQIASLLLLVLTGAIYVITLRRSFIPSHIQLRSVILLFAVPVLSVIFTVVRLFAPIEGLYQVLCMAELFFLVYMACFVSIAIAKQKRWDKIDQTIL